LVLSFETSSRIAGAYGVAISALMLITTLMFYEMSREVWHWRFPRAASVAALFLVVDVLFVFANALKIRYGGWVPLAIAATLFTLMTTWKSGREVLAKRMQEKTVALKIPIAGTTFFLGRETLVASDRPGMAQWRESLFAFMSRNALRATAFFKIPADQVFEVGAQVEL